MILTPFKNGIIFKTNSYFTKNVEELIVKWINIDKKVRNEIYLKKSIDNIFPLNDSTVYIFNANWANPLSNSLFSNQKENSYWITINNHEDLLNFEALLRLHVKSLQKNNEIENIELVKKQLLNNQPYITIHTL